MADTLHPDPPEDAPSAECRGTSPGTNNAWFSRNAETYRDLIEHAPDAIVVHNGECFILANSAALRILGAASAEQVVGQPVLPRIHPDHREMICERISRMRETGQPTPLRELRMLRLDDLPIDVETMGDIVLYQGEPAYQIFIRDISDRKRAEEELRRAKDELEQRVADRTAELAKTVDVLQAEILEHQESESKFRSLFQESKDVIYFMTADGVLTDINPAGEELFGYTRNELLSLDIRRSLYAEPGDRDIFLEQLFSAGFVRDMEIEYRHKDGTRRNVIETATVVRNDACGITGFRGIAHDITERKELERQLLHAQKMESVGLLAGGIAHDFNNLMTAVFGYGQLLRENLDPSQEILNLCTTQIMAATERAIELTRNLLAFSRKQVINPKPVNLNDIVTNLAKLLTRVIGEDIDFQTHLANRPLTVFADNGQIDQVIINLVTNARDAMPTGGLIRIATGHALLDQTAVRRLHLREPGEFACITVSDTGTGMDEQTRARIFEPFFTTKETGRGTGLGLSIIYGIITQHNGAVTVESEPGKGATFTLYLPIVGTEQHECPTDSGPVGRGTETILLAEDDATVRQFLEDILTMAGYTVITARNGEEAEELFRRHQPAIGLVISDVVMPKKNGYELYREISARESDVKFLFISGYTRDIIHRRGLLDESLDFLPKPVPKDILLRRVREILDR